jgi:hypothetical protein
MLNSECGLCSHNEIASLLVFDLFFDIFFNGRELFRGRLQLLISRNHGALLGSKCLTDFSPLDRASQAAQPSLGYYFLSRQFQSCHRLLAECSMPRNQLAPVTWYLTPQLVFPSFFFYLAVCPLRLQGCPGGLRGSRSPGPKLIGSSSSSVFITYCPSLSYM